MTTHFLVHDHGDSVGVAVVEGIEPGTRLNGWIMDTAEALEVTALGSIPLGHKLALGPIAEGATVIKYGHDIGRTIASVAKGEHVHVHNTKTKRW